MQLDTLTKETFPKQLPVEGSVPAVLPIIEEPVKICKVTNEMNDVMIKDAAVSIPLQETKNLETKVKIKVDDDESWKQIPLNQIVKCKYLVNGHPLHLSDEIGKNRNPDTTLDEEEASW